MGTIDKAESLLKITSKFHKIVNMLFHAVSVTFQIFQSLFAVCRESVKLCDIFGVLGNVEAGLIL